MKDLCNDSMLHSLHFINPRETNLHAKVKLITPIFIISA